MNDLRICCQEAMHNSRANEDAVTCGTCGKKFVQILDRQSGDFYQSGRRWLEQPDHLQNSAAVNHEGSLESEEFFPGTVT